MSRSQAAPSSARANLLTKSNAYLFAVHGEEGGGPGLISTECQSCREHTLGKVQICSICFSRDVKKAIAGQHGKLIEFSIARHPAGGFEAPYAIGLVKTEEGLTLFAPIAGDTNTITPGAPLEFVIVELPGDVLGFAFAPVTSKQP